MPKLNFQLPNFRLQYLKLNSYLMAGSGMDWFPNGSEMDFESQL